MLNIVKHVMGEAAKSNVEKRQVGCVITDTTDGVETIVASGFNTEHNHAEVLAIQALNPIQIYGTLKAYVSHPPCPDCAKSFAKVNITEVEVVEAFQKFDGDKLRYDLVDGKFIQHISQRFNTDESARSCLAVREWLWSYQADPTLEREKISGLRCALDVTFCFYDTFADFEEALVRVLTFGARKYKANNWKKCEDTGRYLAAAHRHLIAKDSGETCDPETGFDHMDHVITNLMFLYVLGYTNE